MGNYIGNINFTIAFGEIAHAHFQLIVCLLEFLLLHSWLKPRLTFCAERDVKCRRMLASANVVYRTLPCAT